MPGRRASNTLPKAIDGAIQINPRAEKRKEPPGAAAQVVITPEGTETGGRMSRRSVIERHYAECYWRRISETRRRTER